MTPRQQRGKASRLFRPDGYAGLTALELSSPDVMILGFAMSGLNGAALAKRVL